MRPSCEDSNTERRWPHEHGGRDWSQAAINQAISELPEIGRGKEGLLSYRLRRNMALLTLDFRL